MKVIILLALICLSQSEVIFLQLRECKDGVIKQTVHIKDSLFIEVGYSNLEPYEFESINEYQYLYDYADRNELEKQGLSHYAIKTHSSVNGNIKKLESLLYILDQVSYGEPRIPELVTINYKNIGRINKGFACKLLLEIKDQVLTNLR